MNSRSGKIFRYRNKKITFIFRHEKIDHRNCLQHCKPAFLLKFALYTVAGYVRHIVVVTARAEFLKPFDWSRNVSILLDEIVKCKHNGIERYMQQLIFTCARPRNFNEKDTEEQEGYSSETDSIKLKISSKIPRGKKDSSKRHHHRHHKQQPGEQQFPTQVVTG